MMADLYRFRMRSFDVVYCCGLWFVLIVLSTLMNVCVVSGEKGTAKIWKSALFHAAVWRDFRKCPKFYGIKSAYIIKLHEYVPQIPASAHVAIFSWLLEQYLRYWMAAAHITVNLTNRCFTVSKAPFFPFIIGTYGSYMPLHSSC